MCGLESKPLRKPRACGNLGHVRTHGLVLSPGPRGRTPHRLPAPPCSSVRLPRSQLFVTEDKGTWSRDVRRPLEAGPASLHALLSCSSRRYSSCARKHVRLKSDTHDACETTKIKTAGTPVSPEVRSTPTTWRHCRWTDEEGGQRCPLSLGFLPSASLLLLPSASLLGAPSAPPYPCCHVLCSGVALLRAFGLFPVWGLSLQSGCLFSC